MGADTSYPIGQAIADTSYALSGELGLDAATIKRILSPWVLKKIPQEERHDVLQDLACRALQVRPKTPGLLYSVVKFYVFDWWKARRYRQHQSLDVVVEDDEGEGIPLVETLSDNSRPVDDLACSRVWTREVLLQIPSRIVHIGEKRAMGFPLTSVDRQRLSRWKKGPGLQLGLAED